MPLFIVNEDITRMKVDAIVNAANNTLLGGGGVDGAIHRAAGHKLLKECAGLNGCETGNAKITNGYDLPAKYVIHTVGPIWRGGKYNEENLLKSCYNRSLELAVEHNCQSVAFPMISAGVFGYPKRDAMKVAQNTINEFLSKNENDIDVYIVLYGRDTSEFFDKSDDLDKIIKELDISLKDGVVREDSPNYSGSKPFGVCGAMVTPSTNLLLGAVAGLFNWGVGKPEKKSEKVPEDSGTDDERRCENRNDADSAYAFFEKTSSVDLKDALEKTGEDFSSMVMRKISEKGLNEVKCYKAANVTKQIFSKIRNSAYGDDVSYKPTKNTAIAFAIALELPIEEARELLGKAGYAFSKCDKSDIIAEYCISKKINDIFKVNDILFKYNQPLLGSGARN